MIKRNPKESVFCSRITALIVVASMWPVVASADIDIDEFERRKAAILRESEEFFETVRDPYRRRQQQEQERDAIDALWARHISKYPDEDEVTMGAPLFNDGAIAATGEAGLPGRLSFGWINARTRQATPGPEVAFVLYLIARSPDFQTWQPFASSGNAADGFSIGFTPENANPSGFPEINVKAVPHDRNGNIIHLLDTAGVDRAQGTLAAINLVPEPASAILLAIGALLIHRKRGTNCLS